MHVFICGVQDSFTAKPCVKKIKKIEKIKIKTALPPHFLRNRMRRMIN
jgi:hypothetical protein